MNCLDSTVLLPFLKSVQLERTLGVQNERNNSAGGVLLKVLPPDLGGGSVHLTQCARWTKVLNFSLPCWNIDDDKIEALFLKSLNL